MAQQSIQIFRRLDRLAQRYRTFSPHTILAFVKVSMGLVLLALFFRLAFSVPVNVLTAAPDALVLQSLDESILRSIGEHLRSTAWDFFVVDLSSLGSLAVVTLLCVISVVLFLLSKDPAAAIHLVLVALGGFQISSFAKQFVDRPRPDIIPKLIQVGGKSFPSGHAVTAAAVYLTLAILAARHFRGPYERVVLFGLSVLMISAVAFSRVYMGVHYPSDVLSGIFLGSAWALLMGALFSKKHFSKKNA